MGSPTSLHVSEIKGARWEWCTVPQEGFKHVTPVTSTPLVLMKPPRSKVTRPLASYRCPAFFAICWKVQYDVLAFICLFVCEVISMLVFRMALALVTAPQYRGKRGQVPAPDPPLYCGRASDQAGLTAHPVEVSTLADEVGWGVHLHHVPSLHDNHPGRNRHFVS